MFGLGTTEIGLNYRLRNRLPVPTVPPLPPGAKQTPHVNFVDPEFMNVLENKAHPLHAAAEEFYLHLALNHEVTSACARVPASCSKERLPLGRVRACTFLLCRGQQLSTRRLGRSLTGRKVLTVFASSLFVLPSPVANRQRRGGRVEIESDGSPNVLDEGAIQLVQKPPSLGVGSDTVASFFQGKTQVQ